MKKRISRRKRKTFFVWFFAYLFLIIALFIVFFIHSAPFKKLTIMSPLGKNKTYGNSQLVGLLRKENIAFSRVSIASDSSYLVSISGGGKVFLSPEKDLSTQIRTLQLILKRLTIEGEKVNTLDFRFDKIILKP